MAAPNYELWLTTDEGVRLASLDYALWWQASRQVNRIGNFQMGLPSTFDQSLLNVDRMFQLWRQPSGGALRLWRVYFVRGWRLETSGSRERIVIWGPDSNDLLRRRIVAYYAGNADANYTNDYCDDIMKDIVTAAITDGTAPAPTAGTRVWADLSVAADLSDGPQLDKGCAWKELLTDSGSGVLAELAEASRVAGNEVFFDVVPNSVSSTAIAFQFRTYINQPGMDVSDRVMFSQEDLNLKDPYIQYSYTD